MATIVDRYIGSNGEVLLPLPPEINNLSALVSADTGVYYLPQTHEEVAIEAGNPMGLLLTITYPATP